MSEELADVVRVVDADEHGLTLTVPHHNAEQLLDLIENGVFPAYASG